MCAAHRRAAIIKFRQKRESRNFDKKVPCLKLFCALSLFCSSTSLTTLCYSPASDPLLPAVAFIADCIVAAYYKGNRVCALTHHSGSDPAEILPNRRCGT